MGTDQKVREESAQGSYVPAMAPISLGDARQPSEQLRGTFCRACGSKLFDYAGEGCPRCGESLASTVKDTTPLVGRTVAFRSGLRQKTGPVVADDGATVTVLVDGALVPVEVHKVKEMPSTSEGAVSSAAYRLVLAANDSHRGHAGAVLEHLPALLTTTAARRAFALAAFQRADGKSIQEHSGLAGTEQSWLLMWLAHNLGSSQTVMEHLSQLPADRYPDKVGVIAAQWAIASLEPARSVVVEHLMGVSDDPLAAVLLFLLGEKAWSDVEAVVAALSGIAIATGVGLGSVALAKLRVLAGADAAGSLCVDVLPPQASIAFALVTQGGRETTRLRTVLAMPSPPRHSASLPKRSWPVANP